jgi:hypothetical protein
VRSLLVADEALGPLYPVVRAKALARTFAPYEYKDHVYDGVGVDDDFRAWDLVAGNFGAPIRPELSFFRATMDGHRHTTYIHADTVCAKWAGVLYLSSPPPGIKSGTAFWRHRDFGDYLPEDVTVEEAEQLNAEGETEDAWEMTDFCEMVPGRLILYPAARFHSPYPKNGWGMTPDTARLIWACFFNEG